MQLHLATTADAIARGFANSAGDQNSNWLAVLVMILVAAGMLGLVGYQGLAFLRQKRTPDALLMRQARKAAQLTRDDMRRLTLIARSTDVDSPLTLLLSPSLLQRARNHLDGKDAEAADRILLRLAT